MMLMNVQSSRLAKKNWRQYMQSEMRNANFCYQKRRMC